MEILAITTSCNHFPCVKDVETLFGIYISPLMQSIIGRVDYSHVIHKATSASCEKMVTVMSIFEVYLIGTAET